MDHSAVPLGRLSEIEDGGIYTLHYNGPLPLYKGWSIKTPIYVGKADKLQKRLEEHAISIDEAANLALGEFKVRWLVLESIWIGLAEQTLIDAFSPLWNLTIKGFGNHAPGSGRTAQKRSQWDTLHPGRSWAAKLAKPSQSAAELTRLVRARIERGT